ncbi:MAG: winged helix-turn-helix transcriptional regulator [Verrucomicrobia bacterium]|nr:winged helix-turn-helix transcriptional regulator [Verrucomicrobiota bacterium]MBS0646427.1 winged helix-turn-helix transcriptional regulator [Verrucomicrobiota bacterium]
MLQSLFGNQNIARILFFLFVNERCYATQIQVLLQVPLTPLQQALLKLEKQGIVESHFEGKQRIYRFNEHYPIYAELQALLKKAYTLLSSSEKKQYCFIHKPRLLFTAEADRERMRKHSLKIFWERLARVQSLAFLAKSRHGDQQSIKEGQAHVKVSALSSDVLVFVEKGQWFQKDLAHTVFSNSFRWSLDLQSSLITLEHLRYGAQQPVFLFHLTVTQPHMLESVDAHLCAQDTYLGNIVWNQDQIDFHWRIIGPHKNDNLTYCYI